MRSLLLAYFVSLTLIMSCKEKVAHPTTTHEVIYSEAPNFAGDTVQLRAFLEVPPPTGESRPLLILVHGGGFEIGTAHQAFMRHIAHYFSTRGYVTARISYRLGLPKNWQAWDWFAANIRAIQDLRTFIRYIKYTVAHGNPYGIDTTRIIALGWSAGAFTVLQAAFLETPEELAMVPQADTTQLAELGGLHGTAYPGHSSHFWAAVSLSGAVYNLSWINPTKIKHLVTVHPMYDSIVYYRTQLTHTGITWHGGKEIDSVADKVGISTAHITTRMHSLPNIYPHYWLGDEITTLEPIHDIEDQLYHIFSLWLQGMPLQAEYRYTEVELSLGRILRCSMTQLWCFLQYMGYNNNCVRGCIRTLIERVRSYFRSQNRSEIAAQKTRINHNPP